MGRQQQPPPGAPVRRDGPGRSCPGDGWLLFKPPFRGGFWGGRYATEAPPVQPSGSRAPVPPGRRALPPFSNAQIPEESGGLLERTETSPSAPPASPRPFLPFLSPRSLPTSGLGAGHRGNLPGRAEPGLPCPRPARRRWLCTVWRRMRHLGISLLDPEGCPSPSEPWFCSIYLEHLILITRGIQPSNCDWKKSNSPNSSFIRCFPPASLPPGKRGSSTRFTGKK
ncbi:uncharacterized protein WM294_008334 [Sarcoramphus papa]